MFVPTATFPVTKVGDNAAKVLFGTLVWRSLVHGHETWFIWVVLFQWELAEPPLFGAHNHGHWVVVNVVVNDFLGMWRGGMGKNPCLKIICLAVHLFEVICWCGTSVMSWKGEIIWNQVSFEKQMTGLLKSLEIPWSFLYSPFSICFWREKNGRVEFNFGTSLLPKSSRSTAPRQWKLADFLPNSQLFLWDNLRPHSFLVVVGNRGLLAGQWMFP